MFPKYLLLPTFLLMTLPMIVLGDEPKQQDVNHRITIQVGKNAGIYLDPSKLGDGDSVKQQAVDSYACSSTPPNNFFGQKFAIFRDGPLSNEVKHKINCTGTITDDFKTHATYALDGNSTAGELKDTEGSSPSLNCEFF